MPPPAAPSIRKLAKDLGIDLTRVRGSEPGGRIVLQDVRAYIQQLQQLACAKGEATAAARPRRLNRSILPNGGRCPTSRFRRCGKVISRRMVESWTTIPHVTQFDEADITGH